MMPIAVETEEPIPSPPCHWHNITHTHKVCKGCLTHTHNHSELHPSDSEDESEDLENELMDN